VGETYERNIKVGVGQNPKDTVSKDSSGRSWCRLGRWCDLPVTPKVLNAQHIRQAVSSHSPKASKN